MKKKKQEVWLNFKFPREKKWIFEEEKIRFFEEEKIRFFENFGFCWNFGFLCDCFLDFSVIGFL